MFLQSSAFKLGDAATLILIESITFFSNYH